MLNYSFWQLHQDVMEYAKTFPYEIKAQSIKMFFENKEMETSSFIKIVLNNEKIDAFCSIAFSELELEYGYNTKDCIIAKLELAKQQLLKTEYKF